VTADLIENALYDAMARLDIDDLRADQSVPRFLIEMDRNIRKTPARCRGSI